VFLRVLGVLIKREFNMNFFLANTTNHRRIIMALTTMIFGVLMSVLVYEAPLTFREFVFPPVVGLIVFEFIFRTRMYLRPATLPLYSIVVVIVSEIIYGLLYSASYTYIWSPVSSFQYLFSEYPYNLYALLDAAVMTGMAYYLIKVYRVETWELPPLQSADEVGNEPVVDDGPMTFSRWLAKNQQAIYGFFGWYVINIAIWLLAGSTPGDYLDMNIILNLFVFPVNLIVLIILAVRRPTRKIASGIVTALALNLFISLVLGLIQKRYDCYKIEETK